MAARRITKKWIGWTSREKVLVLLVRRGRWRKVGEKAVIKQRRKMSVKNLDDE